MSLGLLNSRIFVLPTIIGVIAAEGLPLIEDVGGVYGFMEFLRKTGMYEDAKESLLWARGNGWAGKIGNLKTLL